MQVLGILTTFATLFIGYYYAYDDDTSFGLCYEANYPSLRRTCLFDMMGSVLAMVMAFLLLILECASAYINQRDVSIASCIDFITLVYNFVSFLSNYWSLKISYRAY